MDHPNYGESIRGYDWGVMIYKRHNGNILAFDVSMKGDSVGLPDRHWWIPGRECFNFGPSKTNGKIDESKPIKCHDDLGAKKGWFPDFEWSIEGKSIKGGMMDMISTRGVVEGSYFIFGKSN